MKSKKNLTAMITIIAGCTTIVWLSTSTHGQQTTYELRPEITIPEYRTDAARAIDAYERIMERFMDLNADNLSSLNGTVQQLNYKIDSIDAKFNILLDRIAGIEKALGIQPPKYETPKNPRPAKQKASDKYLTQPAP